MRVLTFGCDSLSSKDEDHATHTDRSLIKGSPFRLARWVGCMGVRRPC